MSLFYSMTNEATLDKAQYGWDNLPAGTNGVQAGSWEQQAEQDAVVQTTPKPGGLDM